MSHCYILEGDEPVPVDDIVEWGKWFEQNRKARIVAKTSLGDGAVEVSTVFLGIDHGFGRGQPILYETMIFGGSHDEEQWRYPTKAEAEAHHKEVVALLKIERDYSLGEIDRNGRG